MPRFSISIAMAVVALVAVNCAILQAVVPFHGGWGGFGVVLVGLLPLLNAQIIGLCLVTSQYRISLRRRTQQERVGVAPAFVAVNALALLATIVACVMAPAGVMPYLEYVLGPVEKLFRSMGFQGGDFDSPFFQLFALPLLLGAAMSGLQLLLALMVGRILSRYKLVIISRSGAAMPRDPAASDPRETQIARTHELSD